MAKATCVLYGAAAGIALPVHCLQARSARCARSTPGWAGSDHRAHPPPQSARRGVVARYRRRNHRHRSRVCASRSAGAQDRLSTLRRHGSGGRRACHRMERAVRRPRRRGRAGNSGTGDAIPVRADRRPVASTARAGQIACMDPLGLLRSMMLVRAFEGALMRAPDHGFQLLSSGEEGVAVGVCAGLIADDQLLSSGRSIAPALARGLDPRTVMAELLGKVAGPCGGRGGRGHLAQPSAGFFGAHAVVGGNLTVAAGVALAAQIQGRSSIVACIFGDGACGSGALHETMNIAALWKLPLLLVCNNNQYSVATPRSEMLAPARLSDLARPFGIPALTVDGMDVLAVRDAAIAFAERAR